MEKSEFLKHFIVGNEEFVYFQLFEKQLQEKDFVKVFSKSFSYFKFTFLTKGVVRILKFVEELFDSETKTINELVNSVKAEDVDDATKIAKEKSNALKIKDSAIRIKLEIAKLQNDIIKHKGDAESAINERSGGNITLDDFSKVRDMLKKNANNNEIEED